MDEKQAKDLVNKLINSAYVAGQNCVNSDSLIFKNEEKKALKLGDEVIRYLTNQSSRPDKAEAIRCPDCGKPHCKDYTHLRYKSGR